MSNAKKINKQNSNKPTWCTLKQVTKWFLPNTNWKKSNKTRQHCMQKRTCRWTYNRARVNLSSVKVSHCSDWRSECVPLLGEWNSGYRDSAYLMVSTSHAERGEGVPLVFHFRGLCHVHFTVNMLVTNEKVVTGNMKGSCINVFRFDSERIQ